MALDFIKDWTDKAKSFKSNYLDKANVIGDPGGLGETFNPNGNMQPKQPGVGAPYSGNQQQFIQDPATGLYYDPTTGTTFTDPHGEFPVTDPNVAQQVAANFQRSMGFLGNAGQVYGQQQNLAGVLNQAVAGKGPSAAGIQGAAAMNQISADQLAQASGFGGATAPLARLVASRNIGAAQTGINNQVMAGRIKEQTDARNSLASLLNTMGAQQIGAGTDFSGLAEKGQEAQQGLNSKTDAANQEQKTKNQDRILKGLSMLAA